MTFLDKSDLVKVLDENNWDLECVIKENIAKQEKIDDLENQIEDLNEKVDDLNDEISSLEDRISNQE